MRRAEIVGELDRAFDLFGVHLGLKYHDPQNRAKGGELRVAVDDVKMFFPRARTKTFDVNFKFDGGDRKTDGLFKLDIDYHLEHADDFGVEAGTLRMFREKRGNQWVSHLKTETSGTPYGVRSIVPGALNNLQLDLVSDRQTMLKLNYVNKWRNMDLELQLDRVPGQQVRMRLTHRTWLVMDLTFRAADLDLDLRRLDGEFMVGVDGLVLSEAVSGSVEMSKVPAGRRLKVDISKGDRKALEVDAKIIGNLKEFTSKAAYSVMGGAKQGKLDLSFDHNLLSVSVSDKVSGDKWGLKVFLNPRQKVGIEGLKNKESVWSFLSKIETTPTKLNMKTDININPQAMLYTLMEVYLPFRAFTQRQSLLSFSLDATPHNYLMSKMDLDFDLRGEDDAVLMKVKLEAAAPRYYSLFYVLNVMDVETTITRNIGESLKIETTAGGGIEVLAKGLDYNSSNNKGGRDISIVTKRAGKQMMKAEVSTEKTVTATEMRWVLRDSLEIDPNSVLYRYIVRNYRMLTPFNKRSGEFEIFVNKAERNILFNKFYVKGEVKKDDQTVMKALLTTNESPFKMSLYLPTLWKQFYPDMDKVEVTVPNPKMVLANPGGHSLEVVTNSQRFRGLKISLPAPRKLEMEFNGRKMGGMEYTLGQDFLTAKTTEMDGDQVELKLKWTGRLPSNLDAAAAFLQQNRLELEVRDPSRARTSDVVLGWRMDRAGTPWTGELELHAEGQGPWEGSYTITVGGADIGKVTGSRDRNQIKLSLPVAATFTEGPWAHLSPITTDIHLKYLIKDLDLVGKFFVNMKNKKYSLTFPKGSIFSFLDYIPSPPIFGNFY